MGPVKRGFIRGCPIHNTNSHSLEQCPEKDDAKKLLHFLVTSKANRPLIECIFDYRRIPSFENAASRPWTVAFSIANASHHETHTYHPHPLLETTTQDPAWSDPGLIPHQGQPIPKIPVVLRPVKYQRDACVRLLTEPGLVLMSCRRAR
jgi:hypothetical protein